MKINTRPHLFAIAMPISLLVFGSSLHAAVIYSETFDNTTGSNQSLNVAGVNWRANRGSSATAYDMSNNNSGSSPVISNGTGSDGTGGFLFHNLALNSGQPHIWWTNETTFGDISLLEGITVDLRNENTSENIRFALQVGTSWFVSQSLFNNSSASTWRTDLNLDVANATYRELDFISGTELVMGTAASLPLSGTVNAVGLFTENKSSNNVRIDNFRVSAIPEPTTALLGGLGFLALLRRRR